VVTIEVQCVVSLSHTHTPEGLTTEDGGLIESETPKWWKYEPATLDEY